MLNNCDLEIDENEILTIRVDLRKENGRTRTGGNVQIASTCGNFLIWQNNKPHPKGIKINCTVFRPLLPEDRQ